MLRHDSPVESANYIVDYLNANYASFPAALQVKALAATREASPVARMCLGVEVVFAVVLDENAPERETGLNALGSSALQIAEGNFWGKQDRSIALMKWARFALGEWPDGVDAPVVPEAEPLTGETPAALPGEGGQTPE